jgi:hypothetical protein
MEPCEDATIQPNDSDRPIGTNLSLVPTPLGSPIDYLEEVLCVVFALLLLGKKDIALTC